MILTILILLGIGLAVYTCILHSIGPILGILLAVGYTLGCIIVFLLLVALLSVFIRIDRPADRRTRFYHWLMTNIVQVGMFLLRGAGQCHRPGEDPTRYPLFAGQQPPHHF